MSKKRGYKPNLAHSFHSVFVVHLLYFDGLYLINLLIYSIISKVVRFCIGK